MAGRTTGCAVEPRGEYIFGVVTEEPMRPRRGRERRLVAPGELVAWDPSDRHAGEAIDRQPWSARLLVVEAADLADLASDRESDFTAAAGFADQSHLHRHFQRTLGLTPGAYQRLMVVGPGDAAGA